MSNNTEKTIKTLVIGVGDGGQDAVDNMRILGLDGASFAVINGNDQGFFFLVPRTLKPTLLRCDDLENDERIRNSLSGFDMVFVVATMSDRFGIDNVPLIGKIVKETGALTIGVVVHPFEDRGAHSIEGIHHMKNSVDTLITIPNQNVSTKSPSSEEIDRQSSLALYKAVKAILYTQKSLRLMPVGLEDVCSLMKSSGLAVLGSGYAVGEGSVAAAIKKSIISPLLDTSSLASAKSVLITITAPSSVQIFSIYGAVEIIIQKVHRDAEVIFGLVIDDNIKGVDIAFVATRFAG